ncbi:putative P-type Ca(2+) transporter [Helianthus anomalus]
MKVVALLPPFPTHFQYAPPPAQDTLGGYIRVGLWFLVERTTVPVGRTEPPITDIMWRNLFVQAIFQIIVILTFKFKSKVMLSVEEKVKNTIIFNTFVLCHIESMSSTRGSCFLA